MNVLEEAAMQLSSRFAKEIEEIGINSQIEICLSGDITEQYILNAILFIEATMGKGFAVNYPELISSYVKSSSNNFAAITHQKCFKDALRKLDEISSAIATIANSPISTAIVNNTCQDSFELIASKLSDVAESLDFIASTKG